MKALIISADNFEDSELLAPYYRLLEAGVSVDIAAPAKGEITGKHGYTVTVTRALPDVDPAAYALLVLPGGKAPAVVRRDEKALAVAQHFFAANKPVAAICHGPQILVSAGVLKGRRATCYKTVADELKGAGAQYEDREVVVDGTLVTSRMPGDLPAFQREMMRLIGR
jgi:protease I